MAKVIGPSFQSELRAAGVLGLPFSWDNLGIYMEALTPAQRVTVQAVYNAHNAATALPNSEKDITLDAFLDSTAGAAYKALVVAVRTEINTVRAGLPTPLAALSLQDWRDRIKTAYRAIIT
jgi:hypothetical protein